MRDFVQVHTAAETREAATALARSATQARLAAGVQVVGPVVSLFWHEGELGEGEEWQIVFRTTADRYPELEAHLVEHHAWNNPEITATPITAGSLPYLDWIHHTVESPGDGPNRA